MCIGDAQKAFYKLCGTQEFLLDCYCTVLLRDGVCAPASKAVTYSFRRSPSVFSNYCTFSYFLLGMEHSHATIQSQHHKAVYTLVDFH